METPRRPCACACPWRPAASPWSLLGAPGRAAGARRAGRPSAPRERPERPPRDHRHAARRPRRLLRPPRGLDARPRRPGRPGRRASRPRSPTCPSPGPPTPRSSPGSSRSATASATTAASSSPTRCGPRPRTSARRATGPRRSSPAFPSIRRFGFDRGFETYDDSPAARATTRAARPTSSGPPTRTTDARPALAGGARGGRPGGAGAPFFLWVHYYDPHAPYEPPGEFAARFAARPYDGEVAFVDQQLGRLLRAARGAGLVARATLVLVTVGPRREPRRARRGHPRHLRLRLDAAGPLDHGGAGDPPAGRVDAAVARGIDVAADAPRLRGPIAAPRGRRGAVAARRRPRVGR